MKWKLCRTQASRYEKEYGEVGKENKKVVGIGHILSANWHKNERIKEVS